MVFLKILLLPFSFIYYLFTHFRNHLFNIGYSHSFDFELPVISVGNLRVGGTGKTPHVEYLIRLLKDQYRLSTLSRGYGRKSRGFIIASDRSDAFLVGDEPMQYFNKFGNDITVTVCEDRAYAIPQILFEKPETKLILLDDAYQHRQVKPDLNILLSDYRNPFYTDWLLPAGRLRESRTGASRADVVIISKCTPELDGAQMKDITDHVRKYSKPDVPVFFSALKYGAPEAVYEGSYMPDKKSDVLLFSGIADASALCEKVAADYRLAVNMDFPDHHKYTLKNIGDIIKAFQRIESEDKFILTTEKDMVKLLDQGIRKIFSAFPVFYIPVEVYFLNDKQKFDERVIQTVKAKISRLEILKA